VTSEDVLLVEKAGGIATLTLNRPQALNALNRELGGKLIAALRECGDDDDVRAIVLQGAGRAFCAGDDISGSRAIEGQAPPVRRNSVVDSMRGSGYFAYPQAFAATPKPIICRVHGYAYGAGMDLMLASDIAIAATDARIAAVFVKRAITGGMAQLPRNIGMKKAMEMLMTGDPVDGTEAQALGLVNYAVPPEQLDDTVRVWAEKLAAGPTKVIGVIKFAARRGLEMSLDNAVMMSAVANGEAGRTEDSSEGRRAFFEKRQPHFVGR
jgi:2-(1,2-epoxy-1,2-dihydrophenyl)acetyl-CoA isomerase